MISIRICTRLMQCSVGCLLLAAAAPNVLAEVKKPYETKKARDLPSHPRCAEVAKQMSSESPLIPTDFLSLLSDIKSVNAGPLLRGEFEKSEEYKTRSSKIEREIVKKTNERSGRSDILILKKLPSISMKYDADSEILKFDERYFRSIINSSAEYSQSRASVTIDVDRRVDEKGTYTARNAFGASVEVTRREIHVKGFKWYRDRKKDKYGLYSADNFPDVRSAKKMSPLLAKELRENSYLIVVANVVGPFYESSTSEGRPTFQYPYDYKTKSDYIVVRPVCAAVIDRRSGFIVSNIHLL